MGLTKQQWLNQVILSDGVDFKLYAQCIQTRQRVGKSEGLAIDEALKQYMSERTSADRPAAPHVGALWPERFGLGKPRWKSLMKHLRDAVLRSASTDDVLDEFTTYLLDSKVLGERGVAGDVVRNLLTPRVASGTDKHLKWVKTVLTADADIQRNCNPDDLDVLRSNVEGSNSPLPELVDIAHVLGLAPVSSAPQAST